MNALLIARVALPGSIRLVLFLAVSLLVACESERVSYYEHGFTEMRAYDLIYREQLTLLPDEPGVRVNLGGKDVGATPVQIIGAPGILRVTELGFYDAHVVEETPVVSIGDAGEDRITRTGEGYLARTTERPDGYVVAGGDTQRTITPATPVRWEGGRSYTLEKSPYRVVLTWPDGHKARVEIEPSADDPEVVAALSALAWNDESNRPRSVEVHRVINSADVRTRH